MGRIERKERKKKVEGYTCSRNRESNSPSRTLRKKGVQQVSQFHNAGR